MLLKAAILANAFLIKMSLAQALQSFPTLPAPAASDTACSKWALSLQKEADITDASGNRVAFPYAPRVLEILDPVADAAQFNTTSTWRFKVVSVPIPGKGFIPTDVDTFVYVRNYQMSIRGDDSKFPNCKNFLTYEYNPGPNATCQLHIKIKTENLIQCFGEPKPNGAVDTFSGAVGAVYSGIMGASCTDFVLDDDRGFKVNVQGNLNYAIPVTLNYQNSGTATSSDLTQDTRVNVKVLDQVYDAFNKQASITFQTTSKANVMVAQVGMDTSAPVIPNAPKLATRNSSVTLTNGQYIQNWTATFPIDDCTKMNNEVVALRPSTCLGNGTTCNVPSASLFAASQTFNILLFAGQNCKLSATLSNIDLNMALQNSAPLATPQTPSPFINAPDFTPGSNLAIYFKSDKLATAGMFMQLTKLTIYDKFSPAARNVLFDINTPQCATNKGACISSFAEFRSRSYEKGRMVSWFPTTLSNPTEWKNQTNYGLGTYKANTVTSYIFIAEVKYAVSATGSLNRRSDAVIKSDDAPNMDVGMIMSEFQVTTEKAKHSSSRGIHGESFSSSLVVALAAAGMAIVL